MAAILIRYWGIVGVAAGLLIGDVSVSGWFVPLDTCRILGSSIRKYWTEVLMRGLPVIAIVWAVAWLVNEYIDLPLLRILVMFVSIVLTGTSVGYWVWLNNEERRRVTSLATILWVKVAKKVTRPGE